MPFRRMKRSLRKLRDMPPVKQQERSSIFTSKRWHNRPATTVGPWCWVAPTPSWKTLPLPSMHSQNPSPSVRIVSTCTSRERNLKNVSCVLMILPQTTEVVQARTYKDPQWMEKVAIVRAHQGKTNDVVDALKAAVFQGHPEHPSGYFEIARRLEGWGFLEQALAFAEQGVAKAGSDLLADPANLYDVKTYVRVSTRLRHHGQVFTVLETGLKDSSATLPVFQAQLARSGLAGLTDSQWRENVSTSANRERTGWNEVRARGDGVCSECLFHSRRATVFRAVGGIKVQLHASFRYRGVCHPLGHERISRGSGIAMAL